MTAELAPGAERPTALPAPLRARGHANVFQVVRVIWLREVLIYIRDRPRVVSAFAMPILMLVIFGEGLGNSIGGLPGGIDYRQFIFPGMLAMTVLMTSVMSGISIVTDRQFGFLREILVSPVSRTAIALGKIGGGATIALFQGVVMFVFAPLLGVELSLMMVLKLVPLIALLAITLTSVGVAFGARLRSVESFQMVAQMAIMPTMFLSGIFFPVNNVPAWMSVLVKINPVTYAVAPVRAIALEESFGPAAGDQVAQVQAFGHTFSTTEDVLILAAFGALMVFLAVRGLQRSD